MADLDDFFAKKDKKKSKTKKFLTQEELVKKLEDTSKKAAESKSKSTPAVPTIQEDDGSGNPVEVQPQIPEEEWKEIKEERKDYSNLKIGQMNINEKNQYDSSSESVEDVDLLDANAVDPWKKVTPADQVTQIQMQEVKQPSKVYISPALRNAAARGPSGRLRGANAPDLTNEDFFPTLASARPEEQRKKKNEPAFEEVRHGGRVQHVQDQTKTKSDEVVNRFKSLEETDS